MGKVDYENLKSIEEMIKKGEELAVLHVSDAKTGQWQRIVSKLARESERLDNLDQRFSQLVGIVKEITGSRKNADLLRVYEDDVEIKAAIEIVRPKLNLVIFGAGHVGQAVALMGVMLGYEVILVDDRPEFAARERVPDSRVRLIVGDYSEVFTKLTIHSNSVIVIVTRGHQYDESCLRNVIRLKAGYIGMIGSKRRIMSVINQLKSQGFSDADFSHLHAPIGLNIGARSPQEIAIAIHAEIINQFNRNGQAKLGWKE